MVLLKKLQRRWPETTGLRDHFLMLLPLLATYILQRFEHLIDIRFMNSLGENALAIHSIFFNEFLVGQALGLATATSALILWRRREMQGSQRFILRSHVALALGAGLLLAGLTVAFLPIIVRFFSVPEAYGPVALAYLLFGAANLVLQAVYGTLNAMLIASDQRVRGLIYISLLLIGKIFVGLFAVYVLWNGVSDAASVTQPMLLIGGFTLLALVVMSAFAYRAVSRVSDGGRKLPLKEVTQVWWGEVGIAIVRSVAPVYFSLQLARVEGAQHFYVTYQIALQLAYILVLPLLASAQIAMRDASQVQSHASENELLPLSEGGWFGNYLSVGLAPAELFLLLAALAPGLLIQALFGYIVPIEHQAFLPLYFVACMIGQVGNLMVIRLRSIKKNALVTRNSLVSEIVVQLGLMQILLFFGLATPWTTGLVSLVYCASHLALNARSVFVLRGRQTRSRAKEEIAKENLA